MNEAINEKIVSKVQALLAKAESTTFPDEADALFRVRERLRRRSSGRVRGQSR